MFSVQALHAALDDACDFVVISDCTPPSRGGPFIEYANAPFLRATGYEMHELAGRPYTILLADGNDPAAVDTMASNIELGRDSEKEIIVRRRDGSTLWVEFTGRRVVDHAQRYWIVVGRDITARRRIHDQMATLLSTLDAIDEHIEIYAYEDGIYTLAFSNAAATDETSLFVEALLNNDVIPGSTPLRERLRAGKSVRVTPDGLELRPLGKNAETLICIKQRAS